MNAETCPWDTTPRTIAGMLASCVHLVAWENENNRRAPLAWGIIPTHHFMMELCTKLVTMGDNQ